VSEISCSRQTSFTERSPRRPASTISIFCCAVQLRYLRRSLNPELSLSVERPILSRPPDSPSSATRLQDCPALQPNYLSTQDRGAEQNEHAAFMNKLANEGLILFGRPLA
jgi:hypothetical protein